MRGELEAMATVKKEVEVPSVKLGSQGFEVSAQGLGCMGMSMGYGTAQSQENVTKVIHHAVERGVTFLDTADMYGPHLNEIVVGQALKGIRDKVQIATKFANIMHANGQWETRGDPEYVHEACEASLKRLDVDYIDLYYQHRVDVKVPIEVTVRAMKELVEAGKVKYLGLSEANATDIRRAHAVHPITAVQLEYSLWTRDVEEDIIPTCRELGIGIVPYSPLGRGFLAGFKDPTATEGYDFRKDLPRFQGENLAKNEQIRARVEAIAAAKKCSLNQLALAWVQHKGKDIVAIPGTTKIVNLDSNIDSLGVSLTKEEMEQLEAAVPIHEVAGERYMEGILEKTWRYMSTPPLESWKPTSAGV